MSKKLLIVEDDKDIVELVSHYLQKENFTLTEASDGFSDLKKAQAENFDLIILDIMLPEMSGLKF